MATITSLGFNIYAKWDGSGLDDAKVQLEEFKRDLESIQNNITIRVNFDDAQAKTALDELKAKLANETMNIKANLDDTAVKAELANVTKPRDVSIKASEDTASAARVQAEMDDLAKDRRAQVNANLVGDNTVRAALDSLTKDRKAQIKADLNDLGVAAKIDLLARDRNMKILVEADKSKLDAFTASLDNMRTAASGAIGGVANVGNAITALGLVAVGGGANILGLSGAIVSGFGSAALALGPFAASMMGTIKSSMALYQSLDTLNQQLGVQQSVLATMTPGTSAYNSQLKTIQTTQANINATMANYTPIQQQVAQGMSNLRDTWQSFQQQAEKLTGPILVGGFKLLSDLLPHLLPLVAAVAPIFQNIVNEADKFVKGTGFDKWVDFLVKTGVPNLKNILATVGHLFVTLGQIITGFAGNGLGFTTWLAKVTGELDKWGQGGGFQRFADQIKKDWPQVKAIIEGVGGALGNLIKALNGMGGLGLTTFGLLAKAIGSLSPGQLQAVAVAFIAIKGALIGASVISGIAGGIDSLSKAMTILKDACIGTRIELALLKGQQIGSGLLTGLQALGGLMTGLKDSTVVTAIALKAMAIWEGVVAAATWAWTAAQGALDAVTGTFVALLDSIGIGELLLLIGLIILALIAVGMAIVQLVEHWRGAWTGIKDAATAVWGFLEGAFKVFMDIFLNYTPLGILISNWETVWNGIKTIGLAAWSVLKGAFQIFIQAIKTAWDAISGPLAATWSAAWNLIKTVGLAIWAVINAAWRVLCDFFMGRWSQVGGALAALWGAIWNGIKSVAVAVWDLIKAAWNLFLASFQATWAAVSGALKTAWNAVWNALKTAAQAVWDAMKSAWQTFLNFIKSIWDTVSNALKTAWDTVWGAIKTAAQAVWDALKTAWNTFINGLKTVWDAFSGALKTAWNDVWNTIKTVANGIWDGLKTAWSAVKDSIIATLNYLVDHAKTIWNAIVDVFKTPVNLVIGIWDTVAGVFGLPQVKKLADGGHVQGPGTSTSDSIPAMLSHGEYVLNAKAVNHYGVDHVQNMNAMKLATGGYVSPANHLAGGGSPTTPGGGRVPVPGQGGTPSVGGGKGKGITNPLTPLINAAATVAYDVAKPILDAIVNAIPHPFGIPGIAKVGEPVGDAPWNAAKKVEASVLSIFKAKQDAAKAAAAAANAGGGTGQIPTGQHLQIIDQALAAAGVPPPGTKAQWEAGMNTLITRESGWNSSAVNRTDSNAAAGHPSEGLAQVIASTFSAYVPSSLASKGQMDPVANVAAAIRYIVARYGNITGVQQANASAPPKGYDSGGWMMPGAGSYYNGTSSPEAVLTAGQWADVSALVSQASNGSTGTSGDIHVPITINDATDPQAVKTVILNDVIPQLRMLLRQGTGTR